MLANYGYIDGSGQYYITIDTDKCIACQGHFCVEACPERMFTIETDDYDDNVAVIQDAFRHQIKYKCAPCKPVSSHPELPCIKACTAGAIEHSW
ncbi:MAG: ferredoxin [Calditrichaeota bacterium]|nr:ferredoxin [Calditrichota bacterium]